MEFKPGKKPAVQDDRVPLFANHAAILPPPPAISDWHSLVKQWYMLDNDTLGDCVEAAVLHTILQMLTYSNRTDGGKLIPTTTNAIALYSGSSGYVPGDPSTDQGSYMLGPQGVMQYWLTTGVQFGQIARRELNHVGAFFQLSNTNTTEWMQAIDLFGNVMLGLQVPQNVVAGITAPAIWDDPTGPIAGGHEILLNGYTTGPNGGVLYDLVSWGQHYQATQAFLLGTMDEAVTVYDQAMIMSNTKLDAHGLSAAQLIADMKDFA